MHEVLCLFLLNLARNEILTVVPVRLMRIFQISIWRAPPPPNIFPHIFTETTLAFFLLKSQTAAQPDGGAAVRNKAFQMT